MKKLLVICLTIALVATFGISAFAAGFISSRSLEQAPQLITVKPAGGNTGTTSSNSTVRIVPYGNRSTLTPNLQANMEKAYQEINEKQDQSPISSVINTVAKGSNIKLSNIAVSNLFDIHTEDNSGNVIADGDSYSLTLSSSDAENFLGLMKRNSDGTWELVKDAKVEGGMLSFTFTGAAPYAILVNNTANSTAPATGDSNVYPILIITVLSVLAFTVVVLKSKEQNG